MPPNSQLPFDLQKEFGGILRKLLNDPEFSQFSVYTNPHATGGGGYYGKIGNLKVLFARSGQMTNNTTPTGTTGSFTFPIGFFLAAPYCVLQITDVTARADQWATMSGSVAEYASFYHWAGAAGASTAVNIIALGVV